MVLNLHILLDSLEAEMLMMWNPVSTTILCVVGGIQHFKKSQLVHVQQFAMQNVWHCFTLKLSQNYLMGPPMRVILNSQREESQTSYGTSLC